MEICYVMHVILVVTIVALPALPMRILKRVFWVPVIFPAIWVITGGCPMTDMHSSEDGASSFIQGVLMKVKPDITENDTSNIVSLVMVSSLVASAYRMKGRCK